MQLFSSYVQPLTDWLKLHNNWALFITFLVSFSESVAIIGSIIPGSITMTAIGILAGSGVMRIDLTLLAAVLGAVAGDGLSYLLGFVYRDRLNTMWPLKKYPQWLVYGKDYFSKHGGKSVLIGRFIGPLRSIIPVIAGMLHMNQWRFLVANVLSAIGWSLLYVMPGVLIGAASNQLSPESATEIFIFILVSLALIWLVSWSMRLILISLNRLLRTFFHTQWANGLHQKTVGPLIKKFTPFNEPNHYYTMALFINLCLFLLFFISITCLVQNNVFTKPFNEPIGLFLQSIRTHSFDIIAILIIQTINSLSIAILGLCISVILLYKKDFRSAGYWLSLNIWCLIVGVLCHKLIQAVPPAGNNLNYLFNHSYPSIPLMLAVCQNITLVLYFNKKIKDNLSLSLKVILPTLLILSAFSLIYLGDNWFSDILGSITGGLTISFLHWILYRRNFYTFYSSLYVKLFVVIFALSTAVSIVLFFNPVLQLHQTYQAQYVTTLPMWWEQKTGLLPMYRVSRIGKPVSIFNLQYVGNLQNLEHALTNYGWTKKNETFFYSLLQRINKRQLLQKTPLMTQLYLNRPPILIMTYQSKPQAPIQTLRIWRSNVHLLHYSGPIWLGTINYFDEKRQILETDNASLDYVSHAMPANFHQKRILLKKIVNPPQLLLIEELPDSSALAHQIKGIFHG